MQPVFAKDIVEPCNDKCSFCFLNFADLLSSNYLFNGFKPRAVGDMIKTHKHRVVEYCKGDIIFSNGDVINSLLIIVKGNIVGEVIGAEGKVLHIEEFKAPDALGSAFLFGKDNTIPYDIVAKSDTRLLEIPKRNLLKFLMSDERILQNYLNIITCRAQNQSHKIKLLGLNTLKGKVAYYLNEQLKKGNSDSFVLDKTQSELAEMFGVARPSVSRVLKEMDELGIIIINRKVVTVINIPTLVDLIK